jgi:YacP-like NYN domain
MSGRERWILDGMNVIGSRPDGWWRDRPAAMRALASRLARWAGGREVILVLDGRPIELEARGVEVVFASRGGPDAADDDIVGLVRSDPGSGGLKVVTSDADLSRRVRELGAEVVPAGSFRRMLDSK